MRRRALAGALAVGLSAVLLGCQASRPTPQGHSRGTVSATATTPGAAGQRSAGADAGWVRAENALPGTTAWQIPAGRQAGDQDLAGYADHASVLPGQPVRLFVSSRLGDVTVQAYRIGWYHGAGGRAVGAPLRVRGVRQAAPTVGPDRMVVAPWRPSGTLRTDGWPAGAYVLKLTAADGRQRYMPLTVRSASVAGRLVLVNAVNTYEAYNQWGGYSLYKGPDGSFGHRALRVSFDRPYDGNGAPHLLHFEAAPIRLAESLGLPLAYLTSVDLDSSPEVLRGARGVVSLGHDEYWTTGMRTAVTGARDAGANLAFLGANSVYWRVRLEPGRLGADRVLAGYKSAALDPVKGSPTTTAKWRDLPRPLGEHRLVGMLYECFPARGDLVVRDPGFFLFHGTGATPGASYPGMIGTEIDRAYPIPGTPADLQVVAHSPVRCGPTRRTFADMTYYTTTSGAGVLSVGTMVWVKGINGPDPSYRIDQRSVAFARKVTSNLFAAMAAGPMGRTHPSRGDLAALHESASTSNGTGGTVHG